MRTLLLVLFLAGTAWADPARGWIAADGKKLNVGYAQVAEMTPGFMRILLTDRKPKAPVGLVDSGQPFVEVVCFFQGKPQKASVSTVSLALQGVAAPSEFSWKTPAAWRLFPAWSLQGRRLSVQSRGVQVVPPNDLQPSASWDLSFEVQLPDL